MLRTIGISSLILLFSALFYIFSPTIFGLYFLIAVTTFLVSLLLSVYSAKNHTHYTLTVPSVTTKNAQSEWAIQCTNTSKWFTATTKIQVTWQHTFTKKQYTELVSLTIPARKTAAVTIHPARLHSGQYIIQFEKIVLTDALALFSVEQQTICAQSTVVLPNTSSNPYTHIHEKNSTHLPNATTFAQLNGDELAHLKSYQPGDSVKQIHWKLSSKLDELYVKQFETTTGQQFVVTVDATKLGDDIQLYDRLIEETAAVLFSSIISGRYGQFAFYENGWQLDDITNEMQAKTALQKLLVQPAQSLTISTDAWQHLQQRYPNARLLTTNSARRHEANVITIDSLQGKEEMLDELDDK
ncbi:MAG: DUF58 domain-containing protein [Solibacillus sp.]